MMTRAEAVQATRSAINKESYVSLGLAAAMCFAAVKIAFQVPDANDMKAIVNEETKPMEDKLDKFIEKQGLNTSRLEAMKVQLDAIQRELDSRRGEK